MLGDLLDVVAAALAAGAAAGAKDTASLAVKDAYAGLVDGARRRFGAKVAEQLEEAAHDDAAPGKEQRIRDELARALDGAVLEPDDELVAAARTLLDRASGKFIVDVRESQGVQVGDHNSMTLNLRPPAPR
ncbi:RIP homotypic interaction motif-containing protein [Amycolatopsis sp. NPDC059657]|uniref:RIP homotypic interaction motif-containing protein n=1 Tax=Amycolatopsis sp. NPDC059657 TaxID=3346899 RepID=UPI00366CA9C7